MELVYYISIAVILLSVGIIVFIGMLIKKWFNIYKNVKYVKEAKERQEAEAAKDKAGNINARGKW